MENTLFNCGNGIKFPKGGWVFDEFVVNVFPSHVRKSVPNYDRVHRLVKAVSDDCFDRSGSLRVLDLGCSLGAFERVLLKDSKRDILVDAVDSSSAMIRSAYSDSRVHYYVSDAVEFLENCKEKYDLIVMLYFTQFLSDKDIERLFSSIGSCLNYFGNPNCSIVCSDKFLTGNFSFDEYQRKMLFEFKSGNGFSEEEIIGKRESLFGVQTVRDSDFISDLSYYSSLGNVNVLDSSCGFSCFLLNSSDYNCNGIL